MNHLRYADDVLISSEVEELDTIQELNRTFRQVGLEMNLGTSDKSERGTDKARQHNFRERRKLYRTRTDLFSDVLVTYYVLHPTIHIYLKKKSIRFLSIACCHVWTRND